MIRRFTGREVKEIIISAVALSVIFAYPDFFSQPQIIGVYLIVLGIGFIGHEIAHKLTAIKLGFWSEYRMWNEGLFLALILAIATGGSIVFAAPGAVYFASVSMFKRPTIKDVGLIGIAGPLFNGAVYILSFIGLLLSGFFIFKYLMFANAFLGLFNMIPFGPLDGKKVMEWNPKIWAATFAFFAVAMFI